MSQKNLRDNQIIYFYFTNSELKDKVWLQIRGHVLERKVHTTISSYKTEVDFKVISKFIL